MSGQLIIWLRHGRLSAFFAALILTLSAGLQAAEKFPHYTAPDGGQHFFALELQAPPQPSQQPLEVVFLVDTSASQAGQARLDTIAAVESAVQSLPKETKIKIFAMDVDTEPLTPKFTGNDTRELKVALDVLKERVPLGATDFGKGLQTVRTAFDSGTNARRAVLYLGDGRSMAKTVSSAVFEQEIKNYNEQKIPFTACSVGVQTNFGMMAAFANHTGGNLIAVNPMAADSSAAKNGEPLPLDSAADTAKWGRETGKKLAESATATVVWIDPESIKYPEQCTIFPKVMQPLRSDRTTILAGTAGSEELPVFDLELTGTTADGKIDLPKLNIRPEEKSEDNNYLRAVVTVAAKDGGLTMPMIGGDALPHVKTAFKDNIEQQMDKARTAIDSGNLQQACILLDSVLRLEPDNEIAQSLYQQTDKSLRQRQPEYSSGNVKDENGHAAVDVPNPAGNAGSAPAAPVPVPNGSGDAARSPGYVDAVAKENSVLLDKISNEVRAAVADAVRWTNAKEPEYERALQEIKMMQQIVRNNSALRPAERSALLDRLGNTLKQVEHARYAQEFRSVQQESNLAKERSRQQALQKMEEERVKGIQIFERFKSLMDAEEYQSAVIVAEESVEIIKENTAPHYARRMAQLVDVISRYEKLRYKRQVGFIEHFMEAEMSFIPIPSDPPINYIDRERWLLLSDYRKQKYSTITMQQDDEFVKDTKKLLESRDFRLKIDNTTTFGDLFRQIKEEARRLKLRVVNIDFSPAAQNTGEVRTGTVIAPDGFEHEGMRLRFVLNKLLASFNLTYIIKDEMLQITTIEDAKDGKNMLIKVYPMGDLIVSPQSGGGMGMGGMYGGGGYGGMGGMYGGGGYGGMGGMYGSGGYGGMGGMYGSGGYGGMGGMYGGGGYGSGGYGSGYYSVPDEIVRDIPEQTNELLKKAKEAADAKTFWKEYFQNSKSNPDVIKNAVRRLSREAQTQPNAAAQCTHHIVALVESAILSGNAQPWMYEALTLSLHLNGAPKKQVLRAALSAADFCKDPIDMLNIAFLMRTALNLKQNAFPLYQQALEGMVPKREFYAATLRLAEEIFNEFDDEEPLRWITLAILGQEWDGATGAKLTQEAGDLAAMLHKRMVRQQRIKEANQLTQDIREAKSRDCVVTIEWTGDAGLDLMVCEPANSFCWFKNPRSLSGGMLKTMPVIGTASGTDDVKKIMYVCPKGFNGEYSLLIQRSWGNVANHLVKVSIEKRDTPGESQTEQGKESGTGSVFPFPADSDAIVVNFLLQNGRRQENAAEAALALADAQVSIAQSIIDRNNALRR
ncbi:MAG: VWA domain-containing protein, partial [Planctomycetaceae bacterium]|nr:VWA domain-containing protein [Planctomycetaceae bacterium]